MGLRVIAGHARGRRLRVPKGGDIRPTSGLVRGALFNMLEHRGWLADATLLDLFAGSGALGIEALSRGAAHVVFVESDDVAVRTLRENLAASGLANRAEVMSAAVEPALRRLARTGKHVDGVLADPPYGCGWVDRTLRALAKTDVVVPDGWVAIEHRVDEAPAAVAGFALRASRRHGRTALALLQREGGGEA